MMNKDNNEPRSGVDRSIKLRSWALLGLFLVAGCGLLIWRLYTWQILRHDAMLEAAASQQMKDMTITPQRGQIYDATGKVLAKSSIVWTITADPSQIKAPSLSKEELEAMGGTESDESKAQRRATRVQTIANDLASMLEMDAQELYDKLIDEYLSLHSQRATLERSIAEYERLIATFSGAQAGQWISGQDSSTVTRQIEEISAEMEELYDVVCDTVEEFNGVVSADNITPLTSVVSYSSLNLPMYTGLALIAFLFLSCCLAILLGRLGDFLNYFLYIDRKTNLPNRSRCDLQFDKYSARLLPDLFACLFIQFRFDAQEGVTRKSGDEALKKLGKILRDTLAPEGFIGYNNSGQFVGLFEQCGSEKMDTLVERIIAEIEYTNNLDQAGAIAVNIGYAISSEDEIFEVRKLLHRAIERSKQ